MGTHVIGSGGDYASFAAAEAALSLPETGGTTYQVTGTVTGDHVFSKLDYANGLSFEAVTGEETDQTGSGAFIDGLVTLSSDDFQINFDAVRVKQFNLNAVASTLQSTFTNGFIGQGSTADAVIFQAATRFKISNSIIIDGSDDGVSSATSNVTAMELEKCTIINASRYGAMRCLMTDVFSFGSGTGDFLTPATGSDYLASEDSTATTTNAFTGRTSADFVNYAGGEYNVTGALLTAGSDGGAIGAILPTGANSDPVLDTPQSDVTIQEGQTGTIDTGANFSDANAGDTLTYSISPAMSAGFSFNTSTGVITYDGSQVIAAARTYTVICSDGQGGSPATDTFDITVVTATFVIDSISSTTPDAGSTISINYSNAGGTVTGSSTAGALNKVSDNGSTAVFDVPVPPAFGDLTLNYETAIDFTFSDGTTNDIQSITIQVPSSEAFAEITTIDADGIYANDVGVTAGMFAHAKDITGDMVINLPDGLVTYNPTVNNSFNYAIYDGTEWGTYAAVSYSAETTPPVITLNGAQNLVWVQNVAWVDPGATVTDNVDATRQITADTAPNINTVGSYVLDYNATDVAGNVADTIRRTVTVSSADSTPNQFSFVDVANAELDTLYESIQQITGVDAGQTLTATNGQVSNDGGTTWNSSVQFVTGQTYVKASITTTSDNSTANTVTVTVNGISDDFIVTTKAAVTYTFSLGSSDAVVDTAGDNITYTFPIWELWDKIPEDDTAVKVDSGVNFAVTNGVGSVQTSNAQLATTYIFIARDAGNTPANYIRTAGTVQ